MMDMEKSDGATFEVIPLIKEEVAAEGVQAEDQANEQESPVTEEVNEDVNETIENDSLVINERKEKTKEEDTKDDAKEEEKIVYKVIPVPYYYPVPVDPDWYYENHERLSRQNERMFGFPDPHLEHFRPAFSRPRVREEFVLPSDHYERFKRKSLSYRDSYEKRKRDYSDDERNDYRSGDSSKENLDVKMDREEMSDGNLSSDGVRDVQKKRKRYLMSFPYDQKSRENGMKDIEGTCAEEIRHRQTYNGEEKAVSSPEAHKTDSARVSPQQQNAEAFPRNNPSPKVIYENSAPIPSNAPYVVVPMKPPHSPEGARGRDERSYLPPSSHHQEVRRRVEHYEHFPAYSSGHGNSDMDNKVRYHSNGRRARTVFTRKQLMTLNNVFEKHPFVSGEKMSELSDQLGLDRKIVKIWFQNKRQYARKKGSLVEREEEYYQTYNHVFTAPTMAADKWKNGSE